MDQVLDNFSRVEVGFSLGHLRGRNCLFEVEVIAGEGVFLEGVGGHFVRRTELGFLFIQAYFLGQHLLKLL